MMMTTMMTMMMMMSTMITAETIIATPTTHRASNSSPALQLRTHNRLNRRERRQGVAHPRRRTSSHSNSQSVAPNNRKQAGATLRKAKVKFISQWCFIAYWKIKAIICIHNRQSAMQNIIYFCTKIFLQIFSFQKIQIEPYLHDISFEIICSGKVCKERFWKCNDFHEFAKNGSEIS